MPHPVPPCRNPDHLHCSLAPTCLHPRRGRGSVGGGCMQPDTKRAQRVAQDGGYSCRVQASPHVPGRHRGVEQQEVVVGEHMGLDMGRAGGEGHMSPPLGIPTS